MSYTMQEQYNSRNYTPAAQVQATFGYPHTIIGITIHHWGNKGQQFGTVRDYLCTNTTPTSAHFVAMDGLVACIVSPLDAAWHAGNAQGNAQTIGIECRPEATDGDYATIAELIRYLRSQYGDIPLYRHADWTSTACPGDYDLVRLDKLARNGGTPTPTRPQTTKPIQEDDMPTLDQIFDYPVARRGGRTGMTTLRSTLAFLDSNLDAIPDAVLTKPINRAGGVTGKTTLQSTVAWLDANLDGIREGTDVTAIAAAIPKDLAQQVINALSEKLAK